MSDNRASFGSKLGIILATAGSAVGLGNVWRFPYMAGQNGGAVFILIYIFCVFLLGVPCIISEFIVGRSAQSNSARAFRKFAGKTPWSLIGYAGVLTGIIVTSFYAVISGWCFHYIYASAVGHLHGSPEYFASYFELFEKNPWKPVFWAIVFLGVTHFIIIRGVKDGIEKASKMLMPALFLLLIIIVVAACMLPNAWAGIEFLFNADFSKMTKDVFLDAIGQAFFSLSIGMGCLCTFASYYSRDTNLANSAIQISVIDTVVAILAGLIIFPAAFSVGIRPDSGPSLIFITLPNVFEQAFGSMPIVNYLISLSFYALLALAALTSIISLHEVGTAYLHEERHMSRKKAATIITAICAVVATLCSLSLSNWDFLTLAGKTLFDWLDSITSLLLLPLGGFFTCLFVGWYMPKKITHDEFTNMGTLRGRFYGIYMFCARIICPLLILLVFLHQFNII